MSRSATVMPYRELRIACPCALCVHEMTGERLLDPSTVPGDVGVADCHEVGLYGVQIQWTDDHRTGIYTWRRLRELGDAAAALAGATEAGPASGASEASPASGASEAGE